MPRLTVRTLSARKPKGTTTPPAHWIGNPPSRFQNPWPSFGKQHSLLDVLRTRFGSNRKFVPVPNNREGLVKVRKPDWGRGSQNWQTGLKATWLGHAGFVVETASAKHDGPSEKRGLRILFDAVFSERTSPFSFIGPRRYTPPPFELSELPDIDIVVISHNHYDHLDIATIQHVYQKQKKAGHDIHFIAPLGNKQWFLNSAGANIQPDEVTECDWWDELDVSVEGVGSVKLSCTPTQHGSARSPFDSCKTLWCSWVVEDMLSMKRLYFAGDTAYKATSAETPCPAFAEIGDLHGPFDLALIPIGAYSPEEFLSAVHCAPEDSLKIHKEIKSKKSIGMHWGTVRGGLSAHYEDVREPPQRWKECCEKEGRWGSECALCDVGETVIV